MIGRNTDFVRIFVSHKDEDRAKARTIKDLLEVYAPNRLEFFISGENIIAGEDWQERIRNELRNSTLLLLLFTEPTKNWDWCLFEAGLFTPLIDRDEQRRIICIYPFDSGGPRPLTNLQGIPADVESVSKFLTSLFRTSDITGVEPPLNPKLSPNDIGDVASQICDLFGPRETVPHFACPYVTLQIPKHTSTDKPEIPNESDVAGDAATLAIFGLASGPHKWGNLVDRVGKHGQSDWVEELGQAFQLASRCQLTHPLTATFRAANGGKIFRPLLYSLDLENGRPVTATILFSEELTHPDVGGPMFQLLRMSTRFEEEVVKKHRGKMLGLAKLKGTSNALRQLLEHVQTIEIESINKGLKNRKMIMSYFGDNQILKNKISNIFDAWEKSRESLDESVRNENIEGSEEFLDSVYHLQRLFLVLAAERYLYFVQQDCKDIIEVKNAKNEGGNIVKHRRPIRSA